MKVLIVVDKIGSAIWRLADSVMRNAPYLDIKILPIHPKRNSAEELFQAQDGLSWCDVIDIHYWKSGEVLATSFATEFAKKPKLLFHFNPYDLEKKEWNKMYDTVIVGNASMADTLPYALHIPYAVDLKRFSFVQDYTEENVVHMAVNRIEGKKGVLEVARACKATGYKLILVGRVSEPAYMQEVMQAGSDVIQFRESVTDDELASSYKEAAIHVCNSTDGFESGTLPILEAMASGVPVLTRSIGHVPDLYNGKNLSIRSGAKDDVDNLIASLRELMENRAWRMKMREAAWETVKTYDERKMTWDIVKSYYKLWIDTRPLVSIIIPTKDRAESLVDTLAAISNQDYKKIEIVISDSGKFPVRPIIERIAKHIPFPIKYIEFTGSGYTLAQARNRAVVESHGEILVFCDDRLAPEPNAISKFAEAQTDRVWQWGVKDGTEKGFVENFSCVYRKDLIRYGMFLERMNVYGGMSQEIRTRFEQTNNMVFDLNTDAKATSHKRALSKASRRNDIIDAKLLLHKLYS